MSYLALIVAAVRHSDVGVQTVVAWGALVVAFGLLVVLLVIPMWGIVRYLGVLIDEDMDRGAKREPTHHRPSHSFDNDDAFETRLRTPLIHAGDFRGRRPKCQVHTGELALAPTTKSGHGAAFKEVRR